MKYIVTLNGKNYEVEVEETDAVITAVTDAAVCAPVAAAPAPVAAPAVQAAPAAQAVGNGTKVTAPMPGNILNISTSAGAAVKCGDVLLILEAMKMENEIVAPKDGRVSQLLVQKGSVVNTDDVLAVIE